MFLKSPTPLTPLKHACGQPKTANKQALAVACSLTRSLTGFLPLLLPILPGCYAPIHHDHHHYALSASNYATSFESRGAFIATEKAPGSWCTPDSSHKHAATGTPSLWDITGYVWHRMRKLLFPIWHVKEPVERLQNSRDKNQYPPRHSNSPFIGSEQANERTNKHSNKQQQTCMFYSEYQLSGKPQHPAFHAITSRQSSPTNSE